MKGVKDRIRLAWRALSKPWSLVCDANGHIDYLEFMDEDERFNKRENQRLDKATRVMESYRSQLGIMEQDISHMRRELVHLSGLVASIAERSK